MSENNLNVIKAQLNELATIKTEIKTSIEKIKNDNNDIGINFANYNTEFDKMPFIQMYRGITERGQRINVFY